MLERNARLETIIKLLDAKAKIILWKSETEKVFDGNVWQLYDNKEYDSMYVTQIIFDDISGISAIIADEKKK